MKRGIIILCFTSAAYIICAQSYRSPFNQLEVIVPDSTEGYSFLVGGHFYGGSGSGRSGLPASTVLAGIPLMNATEARFLLSTGDLFIDAVEDRGRYENSFFDRLTMPLINAVGNHDVDNKRYEELYGKRFFSLALGPDRLIVLDTERDDSDIIGEQLEMLQEAIALSARGMLRNLFIVSHRPVWAEKNDTYSPLFKNNTRSLAGCNFKEEVMPILESIAYNSKVYWFSGSMGGTAPASIFWDQPLPGITFLQSAIRNRHRDAILLVSVEDQGVSMKALGLSGQEMPPVEELGVAYWRKYLKRPDGFKWRLLPYYIRTYATHPAFWWGVALSLVISLLYRHIRYRVL